MFAERNPDPFDSGNSPAEGTFRGQRAGLSLASNPLDCKVGEQLHFRSGELTGLEVTVNQIASTRVVVDHQEYVFADYDLCGPQTESTQHLADEDGLVRVRLRTFPNQDGTVEMTVFQAQRLEQGAGWSFEGLSNQPGSASLRDSDGNFRHGFTRIDQATQPYQAERITVGDPLSADGGPATVAKHAIQYLDYERAARDQAGTEYTQWGLVEFNPLTGAMITLFGWDIDPQSIG